MPRTTSPLFAALAIAVLLFATFSTAWQLAASQVTVPNTFTDNTVAVAAEVNDNFNSLATGINDNDTRITNLEQAGPQIAWLKDVKSVGTNGGTSVGGSNTRTLNTLQGNPSFVALTNGSTGTNGSANQFILQPGTYEVTGWSVIGKGNYNIKAQAYLYNVSDGQVVTETLGLSRFLNIAQGGFDPQIVVACGGIFEVTSAKTFALYNDIPSASAQASVGLGVAFGNREEVYSMLRLQKLQ